MVAYQLARQQAYGPADGPLKELSRGLRDRLTCRIGAVPPSLIQLGSHILSEDGDDYERREAGQPREEGPSAIVVAHDETISQAGRLVNGG